MFKPHGIVIPVVTPFDEKGRFMEDEYKKLLQYFDIHTAVISFMIASTCSIVFLLGTYFLFFLIWTK